MKKAAEAKYQISRFTLSSLRATAGSVAISCLAVACVKRDRHVVPLRGTPPDDNSSDSCVNRGFSTSPKVRAIGFLREDDLHLLVDVGVGGEDAAAVEVEGAAIKVGDLAGCFADEQYTRC